MHSAVMPALSSYFDPLPRRHVSRRTIIHISGDPAERLFYLRSGRVKLSTFTAGGNERIVRMVRPGEVFGESGVVLGEAYGTYATATRETCLSWLNRGDVEDLLASDPRFARLMLDLVCRKLRDRRRVNDENCFRRTCDRVAFALLELTRPGPGDRALPPSVTLTHQELAALIGVSRVAVTKAVNQLASEGVVVSGRGCIRIPHPRDLWDWVEGRNHTVAPGEA